MSYYLFTNIYSSVTSQYLFIDGLVDCYEMILFILGAMSTTWLGDTFYQCVNDFMDNVVRKTDV
jgi:hypothetical protein